MRNILFVIHDLGHGGAEKVLVNLVNNIDRTKFNITVMALFGGGINEKYLKDDINLIVCHKKMIRGNSKIMKLFSPEFLFKHYIKNEYDIIVSFLERSTARVVSGCSTPKTKLVSWIHIEQHNKKNASCGFRNYQEALECYSKFDVTICVSNTVKEDFQSIFKIEKPIRVLYNTVETKKILALSQDEITDIIMNKDVFNLVSVAKIVPNKGYDRLMRIHKQLLDEGIPNHIYILGIGEELEKYNNYCQDNGIEDSFTFLGFRDNPYKYVRNADLYVCSSRKEGFSTAVTEALIVGTPVVSTNCSGAYELLGENNEYGIVTENNEDALYEGIKKMLTVPGLLGSYAEKALERGKEFSTEKTVKAVEEMLLSL